MTVLPLPAPARQCKPKPQDVCRWVQRPDSRGRAVLAIRGRLYRLVVCYAPFGPAPDAPPLLIVDAFTDAGKHHQFIRHADGQWSCDCEDATYRGSRDPDHRCKHQRAARAAFARLKATGPAPLPAAA